MWDALRGIFWFLAGALAGAIVFLTTGASVTATNYLQALAGALVAAPFLVCLHEFGHLIPALSLGYRPRRFVVWPFVFAVTPQRALNVRYAREFPILGGSTLALPRDFPDLVRRQVIVVAGGPLASILVAAGAFVIAARVHQAWMWGVAIAAAIMILNVVPSRLKITRNKRVRSDGGLIADLLLPGPRRDASRALLRVVALQANGNRPREIPEALIRTACSLADRSFEEANAHYIAYWWTLDSGDLNAARRLLDHALELLNAAQEHRTVVSVERAFFTARYDGDAATARSMLIASMKAYVHRHTRLRALAATLLAEGKPREAGRTASAASAALESCIEDLSKDAERDLLAALAHDARTKDEVRPAEQG